MGDEISDISKGFFSAAFSQVANFFYERKLKKTLKKMLTDKQFPKGFRSSEQLIAAIGGDRELAVKILINLGARKSENSDEWTLERK